MKKSITFIVLVLSLALPAFSQTFGGGISITGTTNAALQNNGSLITNYLQLTLPAKPFTLSGITSTNETAVLSYAVVMGGTTNVLLVSSLTNSFARGTNGGSWSTNVPSATIAVPFVIWAQAAIGNFTNTIYVP